MTTATETTTRPLVSSFQADSGTISNNRQRYNGDKHSDECFLCGRPLTDKAVENGWMIHLGTDGTLLPEGYYVSADYDDMLDQGCFPVGSECAKAIARPYKFKMGA